MMVMPAHRQEAAPWDLAISLLPTSHASIVDCDAAALQTKRGASRPGLRPPPVASNQNDFQVPAIALRREHGTQTIRNPRDAGGSRNVADSLDRWAREKPPPPPLSIGPDHRFPSLDGAGGGPWHARRRRAGRSALAAGNSVFGDRAFLARLQGTVDADAGPPTASRPPRWRSALAYSRDREDAAQLGGAIDPAAPDWLAPGEPGRGRGRREPSACRRDYRPAQGGGADRSDQIRQWQTGRSGSPAPVRFLTLTSSLRSISASATPCKLSMAAAHARAVADRLPRSAR
jgi:hypothetical protein